MSHPIKAQLPFDSSQNDIVIAQGFNGPYSHKPFSVEGCRYDLSFALDFALPIGTVVQAVRAGIVTCLIKGRGCYTGSDPEQGHKTAASSVIILHPDIREYPSLIYSFYHHLDPESFLVKVGDFVEPGQPIAKTGRTGWIGEIDHLHFNFQYYLLDSKKEASVTTVPFSIDDYNGPLEDAECMRSMLKDPRQLARQILEVREREGIIE